MYSNPFQYPCLEIPWTGEPGGLQSMGSEKSGTQLSNSVTRIPGDGDGQGGLVCCDSWGRKESDTTERLN